MVARFDWKRLSSGRDYRVIQGATCSQRFTFPSTIAPDWSSFAARAQFREGPRNQNSAVVMQAMAIIVDPVARVIDVILPAEVTAAVAVRCGTWDCEIYNGTSVFRVLEGRWVLSEETTE